MKNRGFTMKKGRFTMKNGGFTMKNCGLRWFNHQQFDIWLINDCISYKLWFLSWNIGVYPCKFCHHPG
jgi:hypothetical protein